MFHSVHHNNGYHLELEYNCKVNDTHYNSVYNGLTANLSPIESCSTELLVSKYIN